MMWPKLDFYKDFINKSYWNRPIKNVLVDSHVAKPKARHWGGAFQIVDFAWFDGRCSAGNTTTPTSSYHDNMYNVDELVLYADNKAGRGQYDLDENLCGSVSRFNDALFRRRLHVPCRRPIRARYLYVEARGVADRYSRLFSAVLCEVMVYEWRHSAPASHITWLCWNVADTLAERTEIIKQGTFKLPNLSNHASVILELRLFLSLN